MTKAVILDLVAVGGQLIVDADTMTKPKARESESHERRSDVVAIGKKWKRLAKNPAPLDD